MVRREAEGDGLQPGPFFFGSGPNIIDPWLIWGTP